MWQSRLPTELENRVFGGNTSTFYATPMWTTTRTILPRIIPVHPGLRVKTKHGRISVKLPKIYHCGNYQFINADFLEKIDRVIAKSMQDSIKQETRNTFLRAFTERKQP